MKTFRPCLAEFIGTFYLCFAGIAAILSNTPAVGGTSGLLGIALAHGLALSVAVNVFGGESGAHFNPAVTCGFLVTNRIKPGLGAAYIIVAASRRDNGCRDLPDDLPGAAVTAGNLGLPLPAPWASTGVVLLTEFVLTFTPDDVDLWDRASTNVGRSVKTRRLWHRLDGDLRHSGGRRDHRARR